MNKQPQLMDVARMRDILSSHLSQMREHVFLNSELTMVRGNHTMFSLLMRQKPPFAINDYRLGLIMSGEIDININLQGRHLTSGTLVYIGPGTIIYPKRLSADLRIFGMGLFSNFPMPFAQGQMPSAFNGCTTTTSCSIGRLTSWPAVVHANRPFSTVSSNWLPNTVPSIIR